LWVVWHIAQCRIVTVVWCLVQNEVLWSGISHSVVL